MSRPDDAAAHAAAARDPGRHGGAGLRVVPYRAAWPRAYINESARLLALTRPWLTHAEHIGSTAVPGLCAKPVIDMMLAAPQLAAVTAHCVAPLAAAGYVYVEAYNAYNAAKAAFIATCMDAAAAWHRQR